MKRLIGLLLFICTIVLCSCQQLDKVQKANCRWENEEFGISFEFDGYDTKMEYKTMTFMDKEYSYYVSMERHLFAIFLMDENGNELDDYHKYSNVFIEGRYYDKDLKKVEGKDYQYEISISLIDCQYYEYCQDNGLEFPETLVLYGYAL